MRVLSLDASSTTIGIAIIDYDDGYQSTLFHCEFYKPDKSLELTDMLVKTRKYISDIAINYNVDEVAIEDYIRFMARSSNAKSTILLAVLNMTLRISILDRLGINVIPYSVLTVRHALKEDKVLPKKEEMPELVADHLNIDFPYLYKINRRTKLQQIKEESYDIADAIAVGLAHITILSRPKKVKKKVKKKAKKKVSKK